MFHDCRIYIAPNGLLIKRMKLFQEQVSKYGGEIWSVGGSYPPTHIVMEESNLLNQNKVKNLLKVVNLPFENLECDIVGTLWLSRCIQEKKRLDTQEFKFQLKRKSSDGENDCELIIKVSREETMNVHTHYVYHDEDIELMTLNARIINEFQKLADVYKVRGDRWRTLAYDKAVASLKSYQKPISNINDLKLLPHISPKMIDKILEIMEDGCCIKIREMCNDEKVKVLKLFSHVWGAGPVTAQSWYQKGCRTLEDLANKCDLTSQQQLGLKYYDEIQDRVPRTEVEEIVNFVKNAVRCVNSSLLVVPCGSYRRGKVTCGDIDILVIAQETNQVLKKIIAKLKSTDFIIDDLSLGKTDAGTKYLGLCRLPGKNKKIRRLDIFIVPARNSACAMLHYTGSALFNRGFRKYLAKMNIKLTEYDLLIDGQVVPTPTEESIFEVLKLDYRSPENRDTF